MSPTMAAAMAQFGTELSMVKSIALVSTITVTVLMAQPVPNDVWLQFPARFQLPQVAQLHRAYGFPEDAAPFISDSKFGQSYTVKLLGDKKNNKLAVKVFPKALHITGVKDDLDLRRVLEYVRRLVRAMLLEPLQAPAPSREGAEVPVKPEAGDASGLARGETVPALQLEAHTGCRQQFAVKLEATPGTAGVFMTPPPHANLHPEEDQPEQAMPSTGGALVAPHPRHHPGGGAAAVKLEACRAPSSEDAAVQAGPSEWSVPLHAGSLASCGSDNDEWMDVLDDLMPSLDIDAAVRDIEARAGDNVVSGCPPASCGDSEHPGTGTRRDAQGGFGCSAADVTYRLFATNLINTDCNVGAWIDTQRLYDVFKARKQFVGFPGLRSVVHNTNTHPAVRCCYQHTLEHRGHFFVFASGRVIINGPTPAMIRDAHQFMTRIIQDCYADIALDATEVERLKASRRRGSRRASKPGSSSTTATALDPAAGVVASGETPRSVVASRDFDDMFAV